MYHQLFKPLAGIWLFQGKNEEAKEMPDRILESDSEIVGEDHACSDAKLCNRIYRCLHQLSEAEELVVQVSCPNSYSTEST